MTTRRLVGLAAILIGLVVLGQWLRAREQTVPVQAGTVLLTGRDLQPESLDAIELSIRQPVATASGSGATAPVGPGRGAWPHCSMTPPPV